MNKFATIKHINSFKRVEYYSICLENADISLFELFIRKHTEENKEKLIHIMKWITEIGDKYSAKEFYFRNEAEIADTKALPPQGVDREPTYVEFNDETEENDTVPNNLRLYCFRANDHVVFLFNGDIKTAKRAQDCPNVLPHFKLANALSGALEENFGDEIIWNGNFTDIDFDDNFELEY